MPAGWLSCRLSNQSHGEKQMDRRDFGRATLALAAAWPMARALGDDRPAHENLGPMAAQRWSAIEASVHGRLGVAVLDTATGALAGQRLDARFPMCSTFKFLAAALVLARVDAGQERLDRRIVVTRADLLKWAPVT